MRLIKGLYVGKRDAQIAERVSKSVAAVLEDEQEAIDRL